MSGMQQRWKKLGHVFPSTPKQRQCCRFAALPIVEHVRGALFRVYFTDRDDDNRACVKSLLLELDENPRVVEFNNITLLGHGPAGAFDDRGAMGACLLTRGKETWLYYTGWNTASTVPFRLALGLAIRDEPSGHFRKISEGPIIDRTMVDPYLSASSCVIEDDKKFRMWYISCIRWEQQPDKSLKHYYLVKHAISEDGINWERNDKISVGFRYPNEYAIAMPRVIKDGSIYRMWFSFRAGPKGDSYRIGYAESRDGVSWQRKDEEINLDVTPGAWDSDMLCYPFIFDHAGKRYMLYNGNGYGESGFGLAVLEVTS
jgi:hypothetical protein